MNRDPNQLRDQALRYFEIACLIADPAVARGIAESACELQRLADALEHGERLGAWPAAAIAGRPIAAPAQRA